MFQSESEDLIPRCAPKPSTSGVTAAEFQPSVPEISIVFTQKETGQLIFSPPAVITSYSVWKNKCLPGVGYPPETQSFNTELSSTSKRSNVYPLRSGAAVIPSMNYTAGQIALNKTGVVTKNTESTLQTPYSIESETHNLSPGSYSKIVENIVEGKQSQPYLLKPHEKKILTNSAGTQTDDIFNDAKQPHISSLATKQDIAEIKSMIVEMARDHHHLLETLQISIEKLKLTSDKSKPDIKDIGTQNDEQLTEGDLIRKPSIIKYNSTEKDFSEKEDYDYQHKGSIQTSKIQRPCTAVMPRMPKIATEQSIAMNELAVKYLPNGNLNGMLQEVLIGTKVQNQCESPLKNIENLEKNPTDLSTASYKYLRKYRLLPDEKNNFSPHNNLLNLNSEEQQENLLDLEMIRCKPKFI